MKKLLLILLAIVMAGGAIAQIAPHINKNKKNYVMAPRPTMRIADQEFIGSQTTQAIVSTKSVMEDPSMAWTYYDLQTNASDQNRLYLFPDGTMGAVTTGSHIDDAAWADRGTFYNYFNGTSWGPKPTARIESLRTGWPSYAPWGANGECVVSHRSGTTQMRFLKRATKGTGAWTESEIAPPTGFTFGMLWPRMVTSGTDHMNIHLIALTSPTANAANPASVYNGLDGALLYNRSTDGGTTWGGWQQLSGMTSAEYSGFSGDSYAWAEPHGDTLAFTYGDNWMDQVIMKSTDNGATWEKIVVWECEYEFWTPTPPDTLRFYCSDGTMALALDNDGMAHLAFGLQHASGYPDGGKYWTINMDGMIYWNESMPQLPNELDPDTLWEHGNYVGWCLDTNVFYTPIDSFALFYCSMSGMPTLVTDYDNNVYLIYSSITNFRDSDGYMFRHLFGRVAYNNGATWSDNIFDITSDFLYNFNECTFPFASPTSSPDKLHILFQCDEKAGNFVKSVGNSSYQGQTSSTTNEMYIISPLKADFTLGTGKKPQQTGYVSQNFPNPFKETTAVNVTLTKPATLSLDVYNLMGQKIQTIEKGYVSSGAYRLVINGSQFTKGVYFYTVRINNESYSNKMIVE